MTQHEIRPKPTRWYWVRHAPVLGASTELYDTADEPADVSNEEAFKALAKALPKDAIWFTSDLKRTHQTADAILAHGNTASIRLEDARIAEQHFGDWFGRGRDKAYTSKPPSLRHNFWMVDAATRPNNGESFLDLMARAIPAIDAYSAQYRERTIVAVSHGGVIRAAIAHALGLEPDRALAIMVENLSTTRLDYCPGPGKGGDWRLVFTNKRAV